MHDLNTINRLNAEAHADSIHTAQAAGRWVVATYCGLHLVKTEEFANSEAAADAFLARCQIGEYRTLYHPHPSVNEDADAARPHVVQAHKYIDG